MKMTQIIYASTRSCEEMKALHTLIRDGWQIVKVQKSDRNSELMETYKYTLIRCF